jgi:hypothetical protein
VFVKLKNILGVLRLYYNSAYNIHVLRIIITRLTSGLSVLHEGHEIIRGLPIDDRMSQNSKIYRPRRKARSHHYRQLTVNDLTEHEPFSLI